MTAAPTLPAYVSTNCGDPAFRGNLRERRKAIDTGAFMVLFRNELVYPMVQPLLVPFSREVNRRVDECNKPY
eukprot:5489021-Karenia_brevis.AAC.1